MSIPFHSGIFLVVTSVWLSGIGLGCFLGWWWRGLRDQRRLRGPVSSYLNPTKK